MINYEGMREAVVSGLRKYLGVPIIRANQTAERPKYPYLTYTVITLVSENKGTYGKYEDGYERKPVTSTWSISALSSDNLESVTLANKAREWLDNVGSVFLNDNDVIVQSVGSITNRDNVLTTGYEYKNGFDAVFWTFDEIKSNTVEIIESYEFGNDLASKLAARLDGVKQNKYEMIHTPDKEEQELASDLEERLSGVK